MKTLKKRIAAILTFSMIFELLPVTALPAYAVQEELITGEGYEDAGLFEPYEAGEDELTSEPLFSEPMFSDEGMDRVDIDTDGAVAEQTYNKIVWSIDDAGCLHVSGTNDFKQSADALPPWYAHRDEIRSAKISLTNYTKWLSRMFEDCSNLTEVDFEQLDTRDTTDISNMFKGCSSLRRVEAYKISPYNTSIVKNMSGLFDGCSSLTSIELIGYKKDNKGEPILDENDRKIEVGHFDTSNVTDMSNMFRGCQSLEDEDFELNKFDTTKVTNMDGMFYDCTSVETLDLSKLNIRNGASVTGMLGSTRQVSLAKVYSPKFSSKTNTVRIDLPTNGEWKYEDGDDLKVVRAITADIPQGTLIATDLKSKADDCLSHNKIGDVEWWLYKNGLLEVKGKGEIRENPTDTPPWLAYASQIRSAVIELTRTEDISDMFLGCSSLSMANLSKLNTSYTIDMSYMFSGCTSLETVDLSGLNTAEVKYMKGMFKDCSALKSLNLFQLDTSKVVDMSEMFSGCSTVTDLDFTGEDTSKLKGKARLFNTAKVEDFSGMFNGCSALETLDLSRFDMAKATNVNDMLKDCSTLESLYAPENREAEIILPRCEVSYQPAGMWVNTTNEKRVKILPKNTKAGTLFTFDVAEGTDGPGNVYWYIDGHNTLHIDNGVGDFRAPDAPVPWVKYKDYIETAEIDLTMATDLSRMFENCDKLTAVTWKNNTMTETCTNMFAMFRGCKELTSINLNDFYTSKVTDMSYMFEGCEKITAFSFDPAKFKTDKVMDMRGMFMGCKALPRLDISCFDMSSISESYRVDKMLDNCTMLGEILAPDKLEVKLFLPVIDGKGWILKGDTEFPRKRFLVIPAKTKKATTFVTSDNIDKITLYEENGTTLLKPSYDLDPGQELKIVAKVEPATANPLDIVWTSADKDTASVNVVATTLNETAGTVQVVVKAGDKTGNALITASFGDADAQTFTVRVSSFLKINPSALDIESGKTSENAITATFQNNTYTLDDLIWTSEYPRILKVTPTQTGATLEAKSGITSNIKVKVTATTSDGKYSDICIVTIVPNSDPEPVWGDIDEQYIRDEFSNDPSKVPAGLWYLMPYNTTLSEDVVGYKVYMGSDTLNYSRVYNGSNITFDEELRMYYGVRRLWRGRDYTVVYRNNKLAADSNDKKYPCFTISGVGSFQNTAEFRFNILREDINNAKLYSDEVIPIDAKTKLASIQPSLRYNGTKLLLNKDYKAYYYKDNISGTPIDNPKTYPAAAGDTYYIVMSANEIEDGNFAGVWSNPVKLITLTPGDKTVAKMSRVKVRTKQLLWSETPYKLTDLFNNTVSDNDVFRVVLEGKELVYGTDFTVDDLELFDSGEYTIKIHGTGTPGSLGVSFIGEKSVKLEIKGTPASKVKFAAFTDTVYYNGEPLTMEDLYAEDSTGYENVTLYTYKNGIPELLVEGRDYDEPEFINNTAATGRVSLVIKLKGAYSGVITKTIRVLRYNFNDDTKGLVDINVDNAPFCRAGAKPKVTVTFDGKELVENIDYKLTYKNNNKLGEETDGARAPQVVITGIGNFSGKQTKKFTIYKAPLENIKMVLDDKEYKAKFAKNYYKSSPRILDGGSTVKIGKDKDLEPIGKKAYIYSYANGGGQIPANITQDIPDGTLIEVSVLITAGEKSPYEAGSLTLKGYYRFVSKYKNLKNANITMTTPTELVCSDTIDEVMDLLDKNLTITMKDQKNATVKLVQDRDYEIVSIENYMNPGTAILTIKGKNSYAGTVTCKLKVYRRKE